MIKLEVDERDVDDVMRILNPKRYVKIANEALDVTSRYAKTKLETYPPQTDANRPGPYPKHWYKRGFGPRWARKGKTEGAKWTGQGGGVGGRKTSENLQKSWKITKPRKVGLRSVWTSVSYAAWVQHEGPEKPHQTKFHKQRGWPTDDAVVKDIVDNKVFERAYVRAYNAEVWGQ